MVTWRRIFDAVGLFNELLMSRGDNEWSIRAQDLGFSIEFAPDVVVRHPARSTIKELKSKWARVVCGSEKISKPMWRESPYWVLRSFLPPVFAFRDLYKRKDLSIYEKIVALSVLYYKKIYSTVYVLVVRSSRK